MKRPLTETGRPQAAADKGGRVKGGDQASEVQALKSDFPTEMLCKQLDIWGWSSREKFGLEIKISYHHLCKPFEGFHTDS